MKVSLSQAAKDTSVSLPTLSRWRKSGKISADKNGNNGYIIDTAEYDRILELKKQSQRKGFTKEAVTPHETLNENGSLTVEVKLLRERIKDKDETIQELRDDRDEWKKQAQTLLLQAPKSLNDEKASTNSAFTLLHSIYALCLILLGCLGYIFWQ